MPIFDFKCPRCGQSKEVITSALRGIPFCSCGSLMEKQVTRANFELKGKGWYKDGYE